MYLTFPFIANWDFKKAESLVLNNIEKAGHKIKIPSRSSSNFVDFVWSISGGAPPCSPQYPEVYRSESTILFENKFVLDLKTMDCFLLSADNTRFIRPKSLLYVKDNDFKEKFFDEEILPFSLMLIEENNSYQCIMLDSSLARSLLFRLYYLCGKGLNHFRPYIHQQDIITKTNIMVYAIDWEEQKKG
jgi:hypothetical protein